MYHNKFILKDGKAGTKYENHKADMCMLADVVGFIYYTLHRGFRLGYCGRPYRLGKAPHEALGQAFRGMFYLLTHKQHSIFQS